MLQFPGTQGEGIYSDASLYIRLAALATYPIMVIVSSTIGVGTSKNSNKYGLIVTPPGPFFAVWGIIYTSLLVSGIYCVVSNTWSLGVTVLYAIVNLLNAAWIYVFSFGTTRANNLCAVILISMAVLNEIQWVWMESSSKTSDDVSNWNIANRNIFAFYQGWLVAASNLNLGIVLVHSFGMNKKIHTYFFWVLCPLCIAGMVVFNLTRPKGFVNNIAMYFSAVYALIGAYISTKRKFGKG